MSKQDIFVFVEGGLDRSFYDRLLHNEISRKNISYEIRAAKELPGETGGKSTLLSFFQSLKNLGKLTDESLGKKFSCIFFLDKDIDDFSRKKIKSPHVIYTSTYDLEGHLISCGDLILAIADSCGITRIQATKLIGNQNDFLKNSILNWQDWVTLCMISQVESINIGCTYERGSAINEDGVSDVDHVKLNKFKISLALKLALSEDDFENLYLQYRNRLTREISKGNFLRFFKGKWFGFILQQHMNKHLKIPDANQNSIGDKVMVALLGQVASKSPCCCCEPFCQAIDKVTENFL
ncbi:DUF4435 domain-containing protein [Oxalobacteraceae bacterium]|nr:DUF4435 domain-containing protein [Oxalobacteraceae bacterium]